jgi:endoglucanase
VGEGAMTVRGRRQHRWAAAAAAGLAAASLLSGCGSDKTAPATAAAPASNGVLGEDVSFFLSRGGHADQAVAALRDAGRPKQADEVARRIASRPTATWVTTDASSVYNQAKDIGDTAAAMGTLPVLVAYNLPGRDGGLYSSGGASDIDAYLRWAGSLAAGLGQNPAVVILEPDAVAHLLSGCASRQAAQERFRMLAEAVKILQRQPKVTLYVDAGNASWVRNLDRLASALRASGVGRADGFALNVSNFETTTRSVAYGEALSRRLHGAHFVIDTSRNGAGPPDRAKGRAGQHKNWCNPRGVRLGTPPSTRTSSPLVDAYLWVKQPGDSDGACGAGAPAAGQWWPRYAAELVS